MSVSIHVLARILILLALLLPLAASAATVSHVTDLSVPRNGHTAFLLADGRVVVIGGSAAAVSIEVVDPASGTVEVRDEATEVPIWGHAGTRLRDGQILLTGGGHTGNRTIMTAEWGNSRVETYDPLFQTVTFFGRMTAARQAHRATLLADGRVLIAGGYTSIKQSVFTLTYPTDSAEIFDPATGVFHVVGRMSTPRFGHTATLLADGRVLVAGGAISQPYPQPSKPLASTEIFDPATGTFTPGPAMGAERTSHTATVLDDGRVLLAGGSATTIWAELFDPATMTFTRGPEIGARQAHTATTLHDGRILFFGGAADAVLYDPRTNAIVDRTPLSVARRHHDATLLGDGTVLITGGWEAGITLKDVLRYTPARAKRRVLR